MRRGKSAIPVVVTPAWLANSGKARLRGLNWNRLSHEFIGTLNDESQSLNG